MKTTNIMHKPVISSLKSPYHPVKTIAITGGKGGIGKTSLAINLAIALSLTKLNVTLFDANLGLSSIDVLLDLTKKWGIEHFISGKKSLTDILLEGPSGIKIIPSASGITRMTHLCLQEISGIIQAFNDIHAKTDVLVIDTAPGISQDVMAFASAAQEVIVPLCNDPASIADAYAIIKVLAKEYNVSHFHIVPNMVKSSYEGRELFLKLSKAADRFLDVTLSYAGCIPYDELLKCSVQQRTSVIQSFPCSPAALAIKELSKKIVNWPIINTQQSRITFFFEKLFYSDFVSPSIA